MENMTCAKPSSGHRLPPWLRRRIRETDEVIALKKIIKEKQLNTVCQSAGCPNITECFQKPTATFMILGNICSRRCRFCGVPKGSPTPIDPDEPHRIAEAVRALRLKHVVITSVTRDDLKDGGAGHFACTVSAIKSLCPQVTIETLIPDFQGDLESLRLVLKSGVDILNHNVETVPRLYPDIRPEADFDRSIRVLFHAKELDPDMITKSGMMLGVGEQFEEVIDVFKRLKEVQCDALTIGQYLAPESHSYPTQEYIEPSQFDVYKTHARQTGIRWVAAGPYVRSSYNAEALMREVKEMRV